VSHRSASAHGAAPKTAQTAARHAANFASKLSFLAGTKPAKSWASGARDGPSLSKEQIMKTIGSLRAATVNVLILLIPAVIGPIAVAEGFADVTKPGPVEIDKAALRIDIAAALRALRENLADARVVAPDAAVKDEDVKLAVAEAHDRG